MKPMNWQDYIVVDTMVSRQSLHQGHAIMCQYPVTLLLAFYEEILRSYPSLSRDNTGGTTYALIFCQLVQVGDFYVFAVGSRVLFGIAVRQVATKGCSLFY